MQISKGGELFLFQCDTKIQKEEYYENLADMMADAEEKKELFGFGGTSFIPVFERVDELIEEGKTIDCLIYLSDAEGDFPCKEPEYPVLFVLPFAEKEIQRNEWLKRRVPKWVRLIGIGKGE